jgi:hypothetical protein
VKNSLSRMKVNLAVQITSQTIITMINENGDGMELVGLDDFSPMILVFDKLDRLVDIIKATRSSNKNAKRPAKCHYINLPSHPHLNELLNILAVFYDWRLEAGDDKDSFVPLTTYEDLCWIIFAVVGVGKTHLLDDKTRIMLKNISGTDICDKHFCNIRNQFDQPAVDNYRQGTGRSQAVRSNTVNGKDKGNTSGVAKHYRFDELNLPVMKRSKKVKG